MLKRFYNNRFSIIFAIVTILSIWYWDGVLSIKNDDGVNDPCFEFVDVVKN